MVDPRHLLLFAKVVELGGIRAATRALDIPKATISRSIRELEQALDVRLFERSPRRLRLTELGEIFFQHCRRVVDEINEAEAALSSVKGAVRGHLRIACPVTFGRSLLAPVLSAFMSQYPDIQVALELTNRVVDPTEEAYDFVIRLGPLQDSDLIARDLGELRQVLCASRSWLSKNPIQDPDDLVRHAVVGFFEDGPEHIWRFGKGSETRRITVQPRLQVNDPFVRRDACLEGLGPTIIPAWLLNDSRPRLAPLLPDWAPAMTTHIYALYPNRRSLTVKSKTFLEFLAQHIPQKLGAH